MPKSNKKRQRSSGIELSTQASRSRPKLLFFGDPHGDFEPVLDAVELMQPEAIVLLGDLQPRRPLHIELGPIVHKTDVWYIHGNHDTDSDADHDHLWGSELVNRNLHARVAQVAGLRLAGLGGVFRGEIWDPNGDPAASGFDSPEKLLAHAMRPARRDRSGGLWRGGIARRHRSSIFPSDYQRLLRQRADILVTHEAPGAHRYGWRVLDTLATAMGARLLVHGHHHESIDYVEAGLLPANPPFLVHGVDKGAFLAWP